MIIPIRFFDLFASAFSLFFDYIAIPTCLCEQEFIRQIRITSNLVRYDSIQSLYFHTSDRTAVSSLESGHPVRAFW